MKFPRLFRTTSSLLPNHFLKLAFSDVRSDVLAELDDATESCPWVFGFRKILVCQYGMMGLEATLSAYKITGLIKKIPPVQLDALYIYNALKEDARQRGHTYIPLQKLKYAKKYFQDHEVRSWNRALDFLDKNKVIKREECGQTVHIFIYSNWRAERGTAAGFAQLLQKGTVHPPSWEVDFESSDFDDVRSDCDQWKAVHLICSVPVAILSGKGGCGKTTVVTQTLKHICEKSGPLLETGYREASGEDSLYKGVLADSLLEDTTVTTSQIEDAGNTTAAASQIEEAEEVEEEDSYLSNTVIGSTILLTAPTGKAANLLGRKAKLKSYTLHSIIMSYNMYCKRVAKLRRKNEKIPEWSHSDKEVLVVDECSLVSVKTFSTVFDILLENCAMKKIILLGDVRQLPSIDPGNFLSDAFQTFAPNNFSIELRTNHRAESDLIIKNATKISNKEYPYFDSRKFHLIEPDDSDEQQRDNQIRHLLKNAADLSDHTSSQFISFRNADCAAINELCCKHYNRHTTRNAKRKWNFLVGDKVCLTKNGTVLNHRERLELKEIESEKMDSFVNKIDQKENRTVKTPQISRKERQEIHAKKSLDFVIDKVLAPDLPGPSRVVQNGSFDSQADFSYFSDDICSSPELSNSQRGRGKGGNSENETSDLSYICDNLLLGGDTPEISKDASPQKLSQACTTGLGPVVNDLYASGNVSKSPEVLSTQADPKKSHIIGRSVDVKKNDGNKANEGDISAVASGKMQKKKKRENISVKLCNGEVFFIIDDVTEIDKTNKRRRYLTLSDLDEYRPKVVCVNYKELMKDCKMRHAWARTIHTYQGSESNTVAFVLGKCAFQNWQHVYTAVTRGRKSVYIIGEPETLAHALKRWVEERRTSLKEKLQLKLSEQDELIKTCQSRLMDSFANPSSPQNQKGNAGEDKSVLPSSDSCFLDSDDSWVSQMDEKVLDINNIPALVNIQAKNNTLQTEDLFDGTTESEASCCTTSKTFSNTDIFFSQVISPVKRQHSEEEMLGFKSPTKVQKQSIGITPLKNSLGGLNLNSSTEESYSP